MALRIQKNSYFLHRITTTWRYTGNLNRKGVVNMDQDNANDVAPAKRRRGRPRKKNALTPAQRSAAYRERKKAAGMREARAWIRDVSQGMPLTSDIIDLSQCRNSKRNT